MEERRKFALLVESLGFHSRVDRAGDIEHLGLPKKNVDKAMEQLPTLPNCRELFAVGSDLSDRGLASLEKLPNLEELSLFDTMVCGTGFRHLRMLPRLKTLRFVYGRDGIDCGTKFIYQLPSLMQLEIRQSPLTNAGTTGIGNLKQLRYLDLGDTQIDDGGTTEFAKLTNLTSLYLARANITDRTVHTIALLPELQALDLRWTSATRKCLTALTNLKYLTHLYLGPLLGNDSLVSIGELLSLKVLFLHDCILSDKDILDLSTFQRLEGLALEDCALPEGGMERLRTALPKACEAP